MTDKELSEIQASADEAREEMSKLQADNEKLLAQAREERDVLLKEAAKILIYHFYREAGL